MPFGDMAGMLGMDPLGGNGVGAPPASGGMPGMGGGDPTADLAMSAMGQLGSQAQPTAALQQIEQACTLIHQLASGMGPNLAHFNPRAARDAYAIAQKALSLRSEIRKEPSLSPPPDMMLGMGMGGLPPAGPPSSPASASNFNG